LWKFGILSTTYPDQTIFLIAMRHKKRGVAEPAGSLPKYD